MELDAEQYDSISIVVFGSYARLDASLQSDLDNLALTASEEPTRAREASDVLSTVLAGLRIPMPNPIGVFGGSVYPISGIEEGIGGVQDDYKAMSRRLLLLLESRPIFGTAIHDSVVKRLVTL